MPFYPRVTSTFVIVLIMSIVPCSEGVICGSSTSGKCSADMCYTMVNLIFHDFLLQDCVNGSLMQQYDGQCVGQGSLQECFCSDEDECNTASFDSRPLHPVRTMNCDYSTAVDTIENVKCNGSCYVEHDVDVNITIYGCLESPAFDAFTGFLDNACLAVESSPVTGKAVLCACNSADNCAVELQAHAETLSSKVLCSMGSLPPSRNCSGDFCYIQQYSAVPEVTFFGCLTMDSNAPSVNIFPGSFTGLNGFETIICNKSNCNKDWETALSEIPVTPLPPIIATGPIETLGTTSSFVSTITAESGDIALAKEIIGEVEELIEKAKQFLTDEAQNIGSWFQ